MAIEPSQYLQVKDARFTGQIYFRLITFCPDDPDVDFCLLPDFPYSCQKKILKNEVVWDPLALHQSLLKPGYYYPFTCCCGVPDCAGINAPIKVSHPDDSSLLWDIDIEENASMLADNLPAGIRYIRLHFARREYELILQKMLQAILHAFTQTIPFEQLSHCVGAESLTGIFPDRTSLPAGTFEPYDEDGRDLIADLLSSYPWPSPTRKNRNSAPTPE